jgi:multidrug efflux pump subunit AcrA (membrane-fusion protein)
MNFRTIIAATCTTLSVLAGLTGPPKDGQADPLVAEADINTSKPAADIPDTELTRDAPRSRGGGRLSVRALCPRLSVGRASGQTQRGPLRSRATVCGSLVS